MSLASLLQHLHDLLCCLLVLVDNVASVSYIAGLLLLKDGELFDPLGVLYRNFLLDLFFLQLQNLEHFLG